LHVQGYPFPDDGVSGDELARLDWIDRALDSGLASWIDRYVPERSRDAGDELGPDLGALEGVYEEQYSEIEFVSGHPGAAWN
jgi:hypothetical protein